jgi:enamine deaminase RidA (YjgF/YER057c/UK114 family)
VNTPLRPPAIRPPFGRYHHGMAVPAGSRFVYTSGQLGVRADDSVPETVEEQADIVRLSAFVTKREDMRRYMSVRDRYVGDPLPASTLFIVSGFTRPEFLVEIEAVAARLD